MKHQEDHRTHRVGWLRAAVLGANDGIVSTASLIVGVAAAKPAAKSVLVAGIAGLTAGAMSMAAGEYVSVSSQSDTEKADLARERQELATQPEFEHAELAAIYVERGLDSELAQEVATQLMAKDALGSHARDELGISETLAAKPVQAAFASAGSFAAGAALPLLLVILVPRGGPRLGGLRRLAPFPRPARCPGRPGRRRSRHDFRRPGYLLGSPRDDHHRPGGEPLRHFDLKEARARCSAGAPRLGSRIFNPAVHLPRLDRGCSTPPCTFRDSGAFPGHSCFPGVLFSRHSCFHGIL